MIYNEQFNNMSAEEKADYVCNNHIIGFTDMKKEEQKRLRNGIEFFLNSEVKNNANKE